MLLRQAYYPTYILFKLLGNNDISYGKNGKFKDPSKFESLYSVIALGVYMYGGYLNVQFKSETVFQFHPTMTQIIDIVELIFQPFIISVFIISTMTIYNEHIRKIVETMERVDYSLDSNYFQQLNTVLLYLNCFAIVFYHTCMFVYFYYFTQYFQLVFQQQVLYSYFYRLFFIYFTGLMMYKFVMCLVALVLRFYKFNQFAEKILNRCYRNSKKISQNEINKVNFLLSIHKQLFYCFELINEFLGYSPISLYFMILPINVHILMCLALLHYDDERFYLLPFNQNNLYAYLGFVILCLVAIVGYLMLTILLCELVKYFGMRLVGMVNQKEIETYEEEYLNFHTELQEYIVLLTNRPIQYSTWFFDITPPTILQAFVANISYLLIIFDIEMT